MPDYNGTLMIISNQSTLDNALLLMAGYPDAAQAMYEATRFLIKDRGLNSGQQIVVTGDKGTINTVSIIVLTDAHAAGVQPFNALTFGVAAPTTEAAAAEKAKKPTAKGAKKSRKSKSGKNKPMAKGKTE